ncbi:hypothetical protein [Thalassobacillus sp. C254]|uniref:hypothetical protein n=1 Tax=Thalassobacillus sp. C254 TaxID=1225341 RepID=UPI0006CFFFF7|nr:hypothetical protein [Thalassobacillus sp. C254]
MKKEIGFVSKQDIWIEESQYSTTLWWDGSHYLAFVEEEISGVRSVYYGKSEGEALASIGENKP